MPLYSTFNLSQKAEQIKQTKYGWRVIVQLIYKVGLLWAFSLRTEFKWECKASHSIELIVLYTGWIINLEMDTYNELGSWQLDLCHNNATVYCTLLSEIINMMNTDVLFTCMDENCQVVLLPNALSLSCNMKLIHFYWIPRTLYSISELRMEIFSELDFLWTTCKPDSCDESLDPMPTLCTLLKCMRTAGSSIQAEYVWLKTQCMLNPPLTAWGDYLLIWFKPRLRRLLNSANHRKSCGFDFYFN